ncbi:hypothetical protein COCVIDRAFT_22371 [Bipolaris victoriae FI3]|uniref:Uncharacterized protein n=1 Tax=Bipolaris victoriae (strain FI3) TaxID=930091 RepID=W7F224_BIPV3|nr:hypothetical protein COCVIDRAFT_22371 [Bipolaris victoriae FI3]
MSDPAPFSSDTAPKMMLIQDLRKELEAAIASANRKPKVYNKTAAILVHFQDDDVKCGIVEDELATTFRDVLGIEKVVRVSLEAEKTGKLIFENIRAFFELHPENQCADDCLDIFVISGHGRRHVDMRDGQVKQHTLLISPFIDTESVNGKDPKTLGTRALDWHFGTSILSHASCDKHWRLRWNPLVTRKPTHPFLKALITTLKKLSTSPFTMADVYVRMQQDRRELQLKHVPFDKKNDEKDPVMFGNSKSKGGNAGSESRPDDLQVLVTTHVDENLSESEVEELKNWFRNTVSSTQGGDYQGGRRLEIASFYLAPRSSNISLESAALQQIRVELRWASDCK